MNIFEKNLAVWIALEMGTRILLAILLKKTL
jgi:hypothetical protein